MIYGDFIEAGHKIFGLHAIRDGKCECGDPDCPTAGKHPRSANWQHTPHWSDDQLEVMELSGQLATGYGVLVSSGLLVVDVDARNGGVDSYTRLLETVPEIAGAGLVVNTGSGGGSKHLYFKAPEGVALVQTLAQYPGIDFKSTGYVVGPGSLHASGRIYEAVIGSPTDIQDAPAGLIDLLKMPERYRSRDDSGKVVDFTLAELKDMVMAIPNTADVGHEVYIRIGMGIHEATNGAPEGLAIWLDWAAQSERFGKHGRSRIENRWHSFGKAVNPVTVGTIKHYAEQAGWREPVEFVDQTEWTPINDNPLDTSGIDLLRPPGFVGDVVQWINEQSIFPRENLAVAAALMAVSNCGGMRYSDPLDHSSFNLFCFGVADSSTGKESILQAHNELIRAAGIAGALVGGIKSEQEIFRNLVRHQAAFYSIDELGEHLSKVVNARNKGSTPYLEGILGQLMSIYSKSNSFMPITGDLKEEVRNGLLVERSRLQKAIDGNEDPHGKCAARVARVDRALSTIGMGIEAPFLSIFGVTTPERFDKIMDADMVQNGFIGRALIFREREGNPRIRPRDQRTKTPVPDRIKYALMQLYAPGYADLMDQDQRVERIGEKSPIQTSRDAADALDAVSEYFWQLAEEHKEQTGLQAIPRRGYELVAKVSATLAIPSGHRTTEHVRWAFALVRRDVDDKMRIAHSNSAHEKQDALCSKILSMVTQDHGETIGRIVRACRDYKRTDVEKAIGLLVGAGALREEASTGRGRPTKKVFAKATH
jgi:hypothetical protein